MMQVIAFITAILTFVRVAVSSYDTVNALLRIYRRHFRKKGL